ncbi:putative glycolipid-binding domain-containing protein [Terricaulis sp.]|uniref:putative glycolipid-binding domain-containing protein n=1 Tax=Terricaulis sp. TaxID=2768686 RepID=UPI0037830868
MAQRQKIRRWRRLDHCGLEILHWREHQDGIEAVSTIIDAGPDPFALHYTWNLDRHWRTRDVTLLRTDGDDRTLQIVRTGPASWRVDGIKRPDLEGCREIDISATPLCNGLAVHALGDDGGEFLALHVNAADNLALRPSQQRYERMGPRRWRYIDKGVARGFEAVLDLDADGLVTRYERVFDALT